MCYNSSVRISATASVQLLAPTAVLTEKGFDMNSKAKKLFDKDNDEEVFTSAQVMLQKTRRPILPHEWLRLLGIMNDIQRAKLDKNGPRAIQVYSLSKPLINKIIRSGYSIYAISEKNNPQMTWYEVKW